VRVSGLVSALIVYVDDFGGSVEQHRDQKRMDGILRIIRSFGWVLAPTKLHVDSSCTLQLLGFMLNAQTMTIGVPDGRRDKLRATAQRVWHRRARVHLREVCQLAGQIMSMKLALGLVCRLRSRCLLHSVRDAARANDYCGYTMLNARAAVEAEIFARQLD